MESTLFHKLDSLIEKLHDYPGCDSKTLVIRKTLWIATLMGFFATLFLTLAFILFAPGLTILITYGYVMLSLLFTSLLISHWPRTQLKLYYVIELTILLLTTFYFIFKLGGITTSGGLIFIALSFVLSSIPLQDKRISIYLFSVFTLLLVVAALSSRFLTIPDQMTHRVNSIVFMLNTLWLVAYLLYINLNVIFQQDEIDKLEAEKLKEINQTKSNLFNNITHEFRTPLTIIQGMADLVISKPEEWLETGINKIKTNSNILLRLVNQMLALAKIESGAMQINMRQADVISYLNVLTELFRSVAVTRNIELKFIPAKEYFVMDYDADKMMHIVSNLISNALKYTSEGGRIEVSAFLANHESTFGILVKDNGVGIDNEHLEHLFDRFYQVSAGTAQGGTGLGLAVSKEMAELLNGSLSVKSTIGEGSEFTVLLPVSRNAAPTDDIGMEIDPRHIAEYHQAILVNEVPDTGSNGKSELPVLLIVEDNPDLVQYLSAILNHEYKIEAAANGLIGWEMALELIPDIIISDVMMPGLDGIEMLSRIKNDIRTSHIPVVMLTAKADADSRLAGLEKGADAYLSKPFNQKELQIELKKLVELRKKLHERYAFFEKQPESIATGINMEDVFMLKVRKVLEDNLEDSEFGITQLCGELAVSHTQLYRKFSQLSNQSITNYFKTIRLHKAKEMLANPEMNISQAAYAVGFKNLSHFSREFTREFGKSPSEFRK